MTKQDVTQPKCEHLRWKKVDPERLGCEWICCECGARRKTLPDRNLPTEELITKIARVKAPRAALKAIQHHWGHTRNEGDEVDKALWEMIDRVLKDLPYRWDAYKY